MALEAQDLRAALKAVAAQPDLAQLTGQASPLGRTSVQRALAAHFVGMGLDVPPGQICVAHGGQAALRLAALAIAQRGQRVAATPSPTQAGSSSPASSAWIWNRSPSIATALAR
ncbi:hypothetical protein WJ970_23480 [Achromobacter xylosoxidans]